MIRPATADDLADILRMGQDFAEAIGEAHDRESIVSTAESLMDEDYGVLLVWDDDGIQGMVGGLLLPVFLNQERLQATELFWWVDPGARKSGAGIELLDGLELWAQSQGASRVSMMTMNELDAGVGKLYEKRGYRHTESTYVKEL